MTNLSSDQKNEVILQALDDAIKNGPWDQSNFLRAVGKNLTEIRDNFLKQIGARSPEQLKAETDKAHRLAQRSEQQEVFISLYSSDGINIQTWERIVTNLPRQMISRPIYANEEHVRTVIKSKENKQNEAYIVMYVHQSALITLPPDKALSDKLGHPLLTLKDKTLDLENIVRFVHLSGIYQFRQGRLIKE